MTATLNHPHRTPVQTPLHPMRRDLAVGPGTRQLGGEHRRGHTVWMLVQEGEYHQWCPVSLHTTRESALAAIPAGAVHEPADPDMGVPEEWDVPWRQRSRLAGARLRIQEWEVTP